MSRRSLATVQSRVRNGATSRLDLAQQEAQLRSIEATIPALQEQKREARYALAILLGRAPEGFDVQARTLDGIAAPAAVDGSKFKAVNTRDKNCTAVKLEKRMEQVAAHIAGYLQDLDTADRLEGELTRLNHYRLLAARYDSKLNSGEGDEAFLRQSEIRIDIDYEVEPHFDRIIELINRSNQLNYTKIRIATDGDKAAFRQSLDAFGFKAGIVRAWDKYGDYGVVGFFMTLATLREYKLEHFVFSCRIMNMGIEQYIYDFLNRPNIAVVQPVATPIDTYPAVDWIEIGSSHEIARKLRQQRIVLIGGCDMLQLSTYCSS